MNAHNRDPSTDYYLLLLLNGVNGDFIHHFGTNYLFYSLFLVPVDWCLLQRVYKVVGENFVLKFIIFIYQGKTTVSIRYKIL